jgi:hypothetical protein
MAIRGVHAMWYSTEAEELRAFLRDILELPGVDGGDGWVTFRLPVAELDVQQTDGQPESGVADLSFFCDDIERTMAELQAKGVVFTQPVEDHGYGLVTYFVMPGEFVAQLFQPRAQR